MLWSTCRTPVPERVKLQEVEPSPEAVPAAVIWMLPSMTPLAVPVSLTPPVQVASKTPSMAVALWEVMFHARSLQACDEAGKPVLAERHSPSHDWTEGLVLTASLYPTSTQPWLSSTRPARRSVVGRRGGGGEEREAALGPVLDDGTDGDLRIEVEDVSARDAHQPFRLAGLEQARLESAAARGTVPGDHGV